MAGEAQRLFRETLTLIYAFRRFVPKAGRTGNLAFSYPRPSDRVPPSAICAIRISEGDARSIKAREVEERY